MVESEPGVRDSLVVGVELDDGEYYMPLFVVMSETCGENADTFEELSARLRAELSPRHVPDEILLAPAVPRTRTGKKLEVPVKRILQGASAEDAAALGAVDSPHALRWFAELATARRSGGGVQ